jgi:hypothetical protein
MLSFDLTKHFFIMNRINSFFCNLPVSWKRVFALTLIIFGVITLTLGMISFDNIWQINSGVFQVICGLIFLDNAKKT